MDVMVVLKSIQKQTGMKNAVRDHTVISKLFGLLAFGTNIVRYSSELDSLLKIHKWERM